MDTRKPQSNLTTKQQSQANGYNTQTHINQIRDDNYTRRGINAVCTRCFMTFICRVYFISSKLVLKHIFVHKYNTKSQNLNRGNSFFKLSCSEGMYLERPYWSILTQCVCICVSSRLAIQIFLFPSTEYFPVSITDFEWTVQRNWFRGFISFPMIKRLFCDRKDRTDYVFVLLLGCCELGSR